MNQNWLMKKYPLHFIIVIMAISLVGIIIVQLFWIKNAIHVIEAEYEENVREVLERVVIKAETKEAATLITESLNELKIERIGANSSTIGNQNIIRYFTRDSVVNVNSGVVKLKSGEGYHYVTSNDSNTEHVKVISKTPENVQIISTLTQSKENNGNLIILEDSLIGNQQKTVYYKVTNNYGKVFSKMLIEYETRLKPISERIDLKMLDTLIKNELTEKGLKPIYQYAIINTKTDSIEIKSD